MASRLSVECLGVLAAETKGLGEEGRLSVRSAEPIGNVEQKSRRGPRRWSATWPGRKLGNQNWRTGNRGKTAHLLPRPVSPVGFEVECASRFGGQDKRDS